MKRFKLDEERKIEPGFKVPDGYFDTFAEKMMQQLQDVEPEVKVIPLFKRKPVWAASAAAVFIAAITLLLVVNSNTTGTGQPDAVDIENYLVYQSNIGAYDISQNLDDTDISELQASLVISDDAIEDYFTENNYDIYLNAQ